MRRKRLKRLDSLILPDSGTRARALSFEGGRARAGNLLSTPPSARAGAGVDGVPARAEKGGAGARDHPVIIRVNLTGGNRSGLTGNRSNRSGPVPVPTGTQPAKIQILNLNSKNEKFPKNS